MGIGVIGGSSVFVGKGDGVAVGGSVGRKYASRSVFVSGASRSAAARRASRSIVQR